jgi:hypothetical protein
MYRAVAVASHHEQVCALRLNHFDYLFARASRSNYEFPRHACASHEADDRLPDLCLVLVQGSWPPF